MPKNDRNNIYDVATVDYYDSKASYFHDIYSKKSPKKLYQLAEVFFKDSTSLLDIGCASGRDAEYFSALNFKVTAVDPSKELLKIAKENSNSKVAYASDLLPNLTNLKSQKFDNIFCSAVLMHLPAPSLLGGLSRISDLLNPGGVAIVSWRDISQDDLKESGRLFSNFPGQQVSLIFQSFGCEILYYSHEYSDPDRPDLPWYILVVQKKTEAHTGLSQIQSIILKDKKTSTYKLALLRALSELAQYEPYVVEFNNAHFKDGIDYIKISMEKVARKWIFYYWELYRQDIRQGANPTSSIYNALSEFSDQKIFSPLEINDKSIEYQKLIRKITAIIKEQPVKYMGGVGSDLVFVIEDSLYLKTDIWRDLVIFGHWVENSLLMEWASMTESLNGKKNTIGQYFDVISKTYDRERDQGAIQEFRNTFMNIDGVLEKCFWSGLKPSNIAIDHIIPFNALKIDHLWNFVPAGASLNSQKSDKIPSPSLIASKADQLLEIWKVLGYRHPERFYRELKSALNLRENDLKSSIFSDAISERCAHLVNIRGFDYWEYQV